MRRRFSPLRVPALAFALLAGSTVPAFAADSAKGSISLTSEGKPARVDIIHAYYITAPDSFAPHAPTRRLIFTTTDVLASIKACADASCAMSALDNGMTFELESDPPMARWWVRSRPTQQSGLGNRSMLSLTSDTPERMAGTLTIDSLGVRGTIAFDAGLVKAFD